MSKVKELRIELGWNLVDLAKEAGLNRQTISRAESGLPIESKSAKKIAVALGRGHGVSVKVRDLGVIVK